MDLPQRRATYDPYDPGQASSSTGQDNISRVTRSVTRSEGFVYEDREDRGPPGYFGPPESAPLPSPLEPSRISGNRRSQPEISRASSAGNPAQGAVVSGDAAATVSLVLTATSLAYQTGQTPKSTLILDDIPIPSLVLLRTIVARAIRATMRIREADAMQENCVACAIIDTLIVALIPLLSLVEAFAVLPATWADMQSQLYKYI
eukprot:CAMPEP_0170626458 /NCGR_PEP_ID=MMETSP0224-20130122/31369_1 /TAXON_ID=285029 /ORGANISM="Togula jolla, Strain CCCM 725" /LENGTH=203 /DNA_ID=CAMNT_0010953233 /DNA_START=1 /DNA_END=611 /DNA_ORIENTATION=+